MRSIVRLFIKFIFYFNNIVLFKREKDRRQAFVEITTSEFVRVNGKFSICSKRGLLKFRIYQHKHHWTWYTDLKVGLRHQIAFSSDILKLTNLIPYNDETLRTLSYKKLISDSRAIYGEFDSINTRINAGFLVASGASKSAIERMAGYRTVVESNYEFEFEFISLDRFTEFRSKFVSRF